MPPPPPPPRRAKRGKVWRCTNLFKELIRPFGPKQGATRPARGVLCTTTTPQGGGGGLGRGGLPKYWHFASTISRCVWLGQTTSKNCRPPCPYARVKDVSGPLFGKEASGSLPKYWHLASTTWRHRLQLADRIYLGQTVSTNYRPQFPWSMGKREGCTGKWSGIQCKMCVLLHIRGLRPHRARYEPQPGGPPDLHGGGAERGGGGRARIYKPEVLRSMQPPHTRSLA